MSPYKHVVPLALFLTAAGGAFLGPIGSLSAQTVSTEKAHKAETANRAEEFRQAIRSSQAARERLEAMRKAQKTIEVVRENHQSSVRSGVAPDKAVPLSTTTINRGDVTPKKQQVHRIAIQVDQNDPAVMNLALNNAENVIEYYKGRGEGVQVEIVAFGPGLHMLREDSSPVKDRIKRLREDALPELTFSACGNTQTKMEKSEGKPITILPQATMRSSGVVRLMELQEQGWSYIRP